MTYYLPPFQEPEKSIYTYKCISSPYCLNLAQRGKRILPWGLWKIFYARNLKFCEKFGQALILSVGIGKLAGTVSSFNKSPKESFTYNYYIYIYMV